MCDAAVQVKIETKRLSRRIQRIFFYSNYRDCSLKYESYFIIYSPPCYSLSDEACSASDGVEYIEEVGIAVLWTQVRKEAGEQVYSRYHAFSRLRIKAFAAFLYFLEHLEECANVSISLVKHECLIVQNVYL